MLVDVQIRRVMRSMLKTAFDVVTDMEIPVERITAGPQGASFTYLAGTEFRDPAVPEVSTHAAVVVIVAEAREEVERLLAKIRPSPPQ
jgi:hypothetical protein